MDPAHELFPAKLQVVALGRVEQNLASLVDCFETKHVLLVPRVRVRVRIRVGNQVRVKFRVRVRVRVRVGFRARARVRARAGLG